MTEQIALSHSCPKTRAPPATVPRSWHPRQRQPGWNAPTAALCDRTRHPPARRRTSSPQRLGDSATQSQSCLTLRSVFCAIILSVLYCSRGARAVSVPGGSALSLGGIEKRDEHLLFDALEQPAGRMRLGRRQDGTGTTTVSTEKPTSTLSNEATSMATAASTMQSALPSPFDTTLGNNFTNPSCPAFFHSFLDNSTFNACLPFSLLLQTSNSFFTASRSFVLLAQTLDASCNVNFQLCSAVMVDLAQQIQSSSNCGQDLQLQNPTVMQAYDGFLAYQPLYHAGCLTDSGGNYCFANAVTNGSSPTSSYIYYLPLGMQLPAGTRLACNTCLQQTMQLFQTAAGSSSQPIAGDYMQAAQIVDMGCGPKFADQSVAVNSAASSPPLSNALSPLLALGALVVALLM